MATLQGQPVLILREGTERTRGKDAQTLNIMAAKVIAEAVRSTLGPRGMDKMLVDSLGDVVITNDGVTILKEMDVEHPAAKMIIEVAKTQEDEVGDGTTTAVVLAGEFLKKAEELLEQDIHSAIISSGYRLASEKAMEILNELAIPVSKDDDEMLKKIAMTAMTGKGAEVALDKLAEIAVRAVKSVAEEVNGEVEVDAEYIKIEKRQGGSIDETELIDGVVLDKEVVHPSMPKKVKDAKILLINSALEVKETETDAKIRITDPEMLQKFIEQEEKMLKDMVDKIVNAGANVVICQKGIDDLAQYYLAKAGVLAVRRVKKSDIEKLSKATGAKVLTELRDVKPEDLGAAELVEERKIGDEKMVFITGCKNPKAVTILIRGGTEHVVEEIARGIEDAIRVVECALEDGKVLAGGGAPEIDVSLKLKEWAPTLGGREQLAVEAFAKAMEIIPKTLAENAGLDPIDVLVELKSAHEKGNKYAGVNVETGKVEDMKENGVVEPLRVKTQAIASATEVAVMILRIDDVIAAKELSKEKDKGEGMEGMGDMGGMGGMGMM
ncbi:thermosome subunit [Archaeoglobus sulfaticallidus PM70-1]|uniref:Thermosome subunit n=1 Tax=Archaeoglobus sulfaticallidus PM70-1 TaxID=387631 RepID=N0BE70_9EURY|nr:thermosome subunit beta [Archaeoglobus sulfaticallidus]AGK61924.1 thermosome subunit [Archaeoglobus sulfaticallidus PM70-1]